jgi:hypothetical protein
MTEQLVSCEVVKNTGRMALYTSGGVYCCSTLHCLCEIKCVARHLMTLVQFRVDVGCIAIIYSAST